MSTMPDGPDVTVVLARFGRRPQGEPRLLTGGEDNRNVRVATEAGEVVVRQYLLSAADKVAAELHVVAFLARAGYPTPAPFPADNGELLLRAEHPIAVFPFCPGMVPSRLTEDLAEQCGGLLARFHLLTAGWEDPRIPRVDRVGQLRGVAGSSLAIEGADEWRRRTAAFLDTHRDDLRALDDLPAGPLHHDLHRHNLLVADDQVVAVLDFDELNHGPLIIDLARVWHYAAMEQDDRCLPARLVEAVITGYDKVRPLAPAERALLPMAFDLVNLVEAAGFLGHQPDVPWVAHVDECHSWLAYRLNAGRDW
ncbi:phosphotransferase enzyme family protein [Plantactinospora mayteni]|nr:phosphotransferase [Plantactinospora mayteni]